MNQSPLNERQIRAQRRFAMIAILQDNPVSAVDLLGRLNRQLKEKKLPEVSLRQVQADLGWLQQRLPDGCFRRLTANELAEKPSGSDGQRIFYQVDPVEGFLPVADDLGLLTETEILALMTARGLLSQAVAIGSGADPISTPLSDALDHIIRSLGVSKENAARTDVLSLNQTAAERCNADHLRIILQAVRIGDALSIDYQPLRKKAHPALVQPIRLVLVNGEPYLWAWDGAAKKLKSYKVSRITSITKHARIDTPSNLDFEVRSQLLDSFAGVVGQRSVQVIIQFAAAIIPLVEHRTLGRNQTFTRLTNGDLEARFFTRGLAAVRHWLMQFGQQAVAIEPPELVKWMKDEATAMLKRYP